MHRHRWVVVERIGRVVTERCEVCSKTRTRVRGPVGASAGRPVAGCPDDPMKRSGAATAPSSPIGDAARRGGIGAA